jgi:hypothetical protein
MFETSDECNRFRSGRFSNRAKLGFSASLTVPMWVRRTLTEEESGRLSRRLKEDLSKNPVKAAEEQTLKADNIKRLIGEVNLVEGKTTDQALIAVASGVHDALLKREAARSAAEKAFSGEPLEGVGGRSGARFEIQLGSIRCRSPIPASHSQRRSISQRKRCKLKATSCLTPISLRCSQSWA